MELGQKMMLKKNQYNPDHLSAGTSLLRQRWTGTYEVDPRANQLIEKIDDVIWEKLIFISALSGMTCITRSEFSEVISNPKTKDMTWRLLNESYKVAKAAGAELPESTPSSIMQNFIATKDELVSSMHNDLKKGRPIEVKAINGAISEIARSLPTDAPINEMISTTLDIYNQKARTKI